TVNATANLTITIDVPNAVIGTITLAPFSGNDTLAIGSNSLSTSGLIQLSPGNRGNSNLFITITTGSLISDGKIEIDPPFSAGIGSIAILGNGSITSSGPI